MDAAREELRIVIVGSGFSGLCLGIQLKQAGIHSFEIFEKAESLGGTWRDNTYPGAACDVPAISYCFSFEQKPDWSRKWAPHDEILAYMEHCARKYDLVPHIRFGTELSRARFDQASGVWQLRTVAGEASTAHVLISAVGQLNRPRLPEIPGLDSFGGECFHSARWNHDYDLAEKRVGVVGNAASAIQIIPQIAPDVKQLTIFQRSANWMVPKDDRPYSATELRRLGRHPWLTRLYRWWIWSQYERLYPVFRQNRFLAGRMAQASLADMRDKVADPKLQEELVPDYPIGGKRILFSDDYYPALNRENVEVVTNEIERITETAVETADGRRIPVDALILATGFESTSFLAPMDIEGLDGSNLRSQWDDSAQAYLGISVTGYPNFFMTYGPNTNLGHNSIIFMIECQSNYIVQCIRRLADSGLEYLDLRPEVQAAYNAKLDVELDRMVWNHTGKSWYKNDAGKITNNWSGSTIRYWWQTRHPDFACYRAVARKPKPISAGSPA